MPWFVTGPALWEECHLHLTRLTLGSSSLDVTPSLILPWGISKPSL